ncbi:MAG: hypothetical protein JWP00_578 [Chloroflexi bacterium]|jgi:LysM repeat protein|nr:hypothetical protein [Chloroflexota bacterium]
MSMGNSGNTTTSTSNAEISNLLVQGFKAAKEGRRDEAYEVFCNVVRRDPNNELGWLYRAATTEDLSEAYVCLQRVLAINPANEKAQRGVERIQNRLSAESNTRNATATAAGVEAVSSDLNGAGAPSPRIAEKDVISGFNPGFTSQPQPTTSGQSTTRYPYQEAPSPFNQNQTPAQDAEAAPPPYRPDFGSYNPSAASDRPLTNPGRAGLAGSAAGIGAAATEYTASNSDNQAAADEELVDEPVYAAGAPAGRVGSERETSNARKAGVVGGLASARLRGRAAFGTESPTGLDETGKRRSRMILLPLLVLGVLLAIAALALLLLPNNNIGTTNTNQAAVPATNTVSSASLSTTTGAAQVAPTNAAAVTVPVVGATTTSAAQATTAPAPTTAAPAPTTAAPAPTAAPVATTAAPAAPAPTQAPPPPPATTAAPPPAPTLPRAAIYVIKSGDNLTRIAAQYSTSIAAIAAANPTVDINRIFSGNRLVIPVSRPDFRGKGGAILAPNETLQTLSDRFKVSVDEITRFNGLTNPADAKPGDAILVP